MSDEIKVGDRVHVSVEYDGIVCVLDGDEACVEDDDGIHCTHVLSELTRLDPEPVTLRAKYPVGSKVKFYAVDSNEPTYDVIEARIDYLLERPDGSRTCHTEFQLEPVPTPCPTCKGSGKSEGSA